MSLKKQLSDMDAKLKALQFRINRSEEILSKGERIAIERQRESITTIVSTITLLKGSIEEAKFAQGETEEAVEQWSNEIDAQVVQADTCNDKLSKFVEDINQKAKESELAQSHEQKIKFEKQLLEQKFEAALKERQLAEKSARLPKLSITKFNGKPHDWVRFSGQFKAMVDSQNVPAITKFSHLKELVEPQIRRAIDCLPFTEEGYKRAVKYLEEKYGHPSEVAGSYVENLIELPSIIERDVPKIHRFYEQLLFNVESLETLGKLNTIQGATFYVIKKLEIVKAELVSHIQKDWRDWTFKELLEALRKWTETNANVKTQNRNKGMDSLKQTAGGRAFNSRDHEVKCVYCESVDHKTSSCDKVTTSGERKKILVKKRLCFNCASGQHAANSCKSKISCQVCKKRHHTSICQASEEEEEKVLTVSDGKTSVVHPVVVVKINGQKFRALLDSGASHSYASTTLINQVKATTVKNSTRRVATLFGVITTKLAECDITLGAAKGDFVLEARVTKINKRELLTLDNPNYGKLIEEQQHLRGIVMEDKTTAEKLPVHLILGANEYAKIRTSTQSRIGRQGEPVAELTRFGWAIMAPGQKVDLTAGCIAVNSSTDYDRLCALDVLGLADSPSGDQGMVHQEFREQLSRHPVEGWYETSLTWKGNHPPLPTNRSGSIRRMRAQVTKLKRAGYLKEYDAIIREQLEQGVVEKAPPQVVGREVYTPHRAVIREGAESTKLRIVYDCSARAGPGLPSLNDCLDPGPPLQNKLWDVMVRGRFHPVVVTGDMRKAFLQVRIREGERDALRFHWLKSPTSTEVETLRFTRALFGLAPSPFLLGGVVEQHLESWRERCPQSVNEIQHSLYVDDLISGGTTVNDAQDLKRDAIKIFDDAGFCLHKWHSNAPELEDVETKAVKSDGESTYAKQQLDASTSEGCKLLGLRWDRKEDTLSVAFPIENADTTKRGILGKLAKIYDPLGLVSPVTLEGKLFYREACDLKQAWDSPLPQALMTKWKKWESALPSSVTTKRSLVNFREPIEAVELHAFGDASGRGVCAAVYAVARQASGVSQGIVAAKSRLSKRGLTIPRLELVAGHMAVNLVDNLRRALQGFPVVSIYCWLDSTVALHWICGRGEYRQFVQNRLRKIQDHKIDAWRHVPTAENPADLGSRGGSVGDSKLWWNGPEWLSNPEKWPPNPVINASDQSAAEAKVIREVIAAVAVDETDEFDHLLDKHDLKRTLRVCAWITRFIRNCRGRATLRNAGPLTTDELEDRTKWWIRRVQRRAQTCPNYNVDQLQLNLQENTEGILECRGRIQGNYPAYLPDASEFAAKLVKRAHDETLHGGVGLTLAKVRGKYWIPRLRRLAKRTIKSCWGCKRFQAIALAAPPPGLLPKERTQGSTTFEVVGVDFAGPIRYRKKPKVEGKTYLVLFACSLSRALHLELLLSLDTLEFLGALKRFIARRGRPSRIFSDNGKTFVAAAKWLKKAMQDEQLHDYLADKGISWQFNLSRAPWWGGQFERLVGVFKRAFYKTVGAGLLTYAELCEIVLNVETELNNRPLDYVEDDLQLPMLTPATFLFQRPNTIPEPEPWRDEDVNLRKRARYLRSCKDALWKRWSTEYLTALRERHRCNRDDKPPTLAVGDVVIIRSDNRNRAKWPLGIVEQLFPGKDEVVRAVKLRAGKSYLERPVQHLYPLELSCNKCDVQPTELNAEAPPFRPRRDAAAAANLRIQENFQNEQEL